MVRRAWQQGHVISVVLSGVSVIRSLLRYAPW